MIMVMLVVYSSHIFNSDIQLYSMIRDPKVDSVELERTVTDEVRTGKAAEEGQEGGLQADK